MVLETRRTAERKWSCPKFNAGTYRSPNPCTGITIGTGRPMADANLRIIAAAFALGVEPDRSDPAGVTIADPDHFQSRLRTLAEAITADRNTDEFTVVPKDLLRSMFKVMMDAGFEPGDIAEIIAEEGRTDEVRVLLDTTDLKPPPTLATDDPLLDPVPHPSLEVTVSRDEQRIRRLRPGGGDYRHNTDPRHLQDRMLEGRHREDADVGKPGFQGPRPTINISRPSLDDPGIPDMTDRRPQTVIPRPGSLHGSTPRRPVSNPKMPAQGTAEYENVRSAQIAMANWRGRMDHRHAATAAPSSPGPEARRPEPAPEPAAPRPRF